jgi:hypothetical protein
VKRSINRILTTHAGSLPRPEDLLELYGEDAPDLKLLPRLHGSIAAEPVKHDGAVCPLLIFSDLKTRQTIIDVRPPGAEVAHSAEPRPLAFGVCARRADVGLCGCVCLGGPRNAPGVEILRPPRVSPPCCRCRG